MTTSFQPIGIDASLGMYETLRLRVTASGTGGIVTLTTRAYAQRIGADHNWASKALPADFKIVYYLDGKTISGQLGAPHTFMLDTRTYDDGLHAVWVVLVEGTNAHRYRCIGERLKINNSGKIDTQGQAPTFGLENRGACYRTPLPDWVDIPNRRPLHMVSVYPVVVSPPAHTLPDSSVMRNSRSWIAEPITQLSSGLYQGTPSWYKDAEGWPYIDMFYPHTQPELEPAMERSWLNDFYDGPRQNSAINPYSTLAFCKFSAKLMGVGLQGNFWELSSTGILRTLYGPAGDPAEIPVKDSRAFYKGFVGASQDGEPIELECCTDLTQSLTNPKLWYFADMEHGRIIQVDLSGTVAMASVYVDNTPSISSLFITLDETIVACLMPRTEDGVDYPKGLIAIDPNKNIRHLNIDLPGLVTPMCVRPTSDYKIIICDQTSLYVYEIDPVLNTSRQVAIPETALPLPGQTPVIIPQKPSLPHSNWSWIDVDRLGTCGPVDDIFFCQYRGGGNNLAVRIPRYNIVAGTIAKPIQNSSNGYVRVGAAENTHETQGGHYPWAVAISPREARMAFYGGGGDGLIMLRGRVPSDPPASFDLTAYNIGRAVLRNGTIDGFPFGIRPSFTALYNPYGHHKLGLKTTDELAAMADIDLATSIQRGLGGTVARPEIVGYPLACLMYFIRKNSIVALAKAIPAPVKPADKAPPSISAVQTKINADGSVNVMWLTDEPALGYVAFGYNKVTTVNADGSETVVWKYHRWSEPEASFSTQHSVTLRHVPSVVMFSVRCVDPAGNVFFGPDTVLT